MMRILQTYFFIFRFSHFSWANSVLLPHVSLFAIKLLIISTPDAPDSYTIRWKWLTMLRKFVLNLEFQSIHVVVARSEYFQLENIFIAKFLRCIGINI